MSVFVQGLFAPGLFAPDLFVGGEGAVEPIIISTVLEQGTFGQPYSDFILVSGSSPFVFAIIAGSLPGGLSLNPATGEISGVLTTEGSYVFTVEVTNEFGSDIGTITIPSLGFTTQGVIRQMKKGALTYRESF